MDIIDVVFGDGQQDKRCQKMQQGRDVRVELLRCLACFLVVQTHIRCLPFQDGGVLKRSALLVATLRAPAVGIFFLIGGFFIKGEQSILRMWKGFFLRIGIPFGLYVIAAGILREWLDDPSVEGLFTGSLLSSLRAAQPAAILGGLFSAVLSFDTVRLGDYTGHLWYVFYYAIVLLWMPLLSGLVRLQDRKLMLYMLVFSMLHVVLKDVSIFCPAASYYLSIPDGIFVPAAYALAGKLLYQAVRERGAWGKAVKERDAGGKALLFYGLSFLLVSLILFFLQRNMYLLGLSQGREPDALNYDNYFLSWNASLAMVQACLLSAFVLSLPLDGLPEGLCQGITWLGSYTFPIFLVHFMFTQKCRVLGIEDFFQGFFGTTALGIFSYALFYGLLVFLLSLLMSVLLRMIWKTAYAFFHR